jgi:L-lactate dehydrogenase (cytochrome)
MDKLLKPSLTMGVVDPATITPEHVAQPEQKKAAAPKKPVKAEVAEGQEMAVEEFVKPPLAAMLNTFDFESVAREVMEPQAWGYYSSGGDDEITLRDNHMAFQRITMRPRILVNVREIDLSTTLLGVPSSLPLYFTATALGKLAHQDGEVAITRAAKKAGVAYMLPTLSSYTLEEMLGARVGGQDLFAQLYVNPERSRTQEYVEKLEAAGVKALFITVDAPQLGRREKDMRNKFTQQGSDVQGDDDETGEVDRSQGATRAISSYIDPGLCWDDIPWFKSITKMKILLKGVQCAEDAVQAYKMGLNGCVLSNHGGRQLDTCRSGIEVLPEVMEALREAGCTKDQFSVFVDGGIRRGADIFKAVALGAAGCGVGRPVLYSLASYGEKGIVRMVHMLQDELTMVMRLSGTPDVASITSNHVITKNLSDHIVPLPADNLVQKTYMPLLPAARL